MSKRIPRGQYRLLVDAVYERDNWRCVLCRCRTRLTPHHVIPRSHGGEDTAENLITLCVTCHERQEGAGWQRNRAYFEGWIKGRRGRRKGVRLPSVP